MTTFVPASGSPGQVGYGLGLEQYELPGGVEIIGHVRGTAGYLSFVGHLPEQQAAISMVINTRDDPLPVIMPAVELLIAEAPANSSLTHHPGQSPNILGLFSHKQTERSH